MLLSCPDCDDGTCPRCEKLKDDAMEADAERRRLLHEQREDDADLAWDQRKHQERAGF